MRKVEGFKGALRAVLLIGFLVLGASMLFAQGPKIGVVMPTMNVYWLALSNAVRDAAEKAGGTAIITDAQQYKVAKELANVEDLLQQNIDLLVIAPCDNVASTPAIEEANNANVPVVFVDTDAGGQALTTIASNNYLAGTLAAEFVMKQINYKGNVAIINGPPVTAVFERIRAFKDVVAKYKNVKIVGDQIMGNTIADGVNIAENLLQANPNLNGYLCMNDFAFLGALTALQNAGKVGKVAIGSIDGMPDVVTILAAGLAPKAATAAQLPAEMGRLAVQAFLDYKAGKSVPKEIKVKVELITKENASGFHW
jgi:ribose transport system substrate-binding protein